MLRHVNLTIYLDFWGVVINFQRQILKHALVLSKEVKSWIRSSYSCSEAFDTTFICFVTHRNGAYLIRLFFIKEMCGWAYFFLSPKLFSFLFHLYFITIVTGEGCFHLMYLKSKRN